MYKALVLNTCWLPTHITNARRCISLIFKGHARALDGDCASYDFEQWMAKTGELIHLPKMHSIKYAVAVPEIILLTKYDRLPRHKVVFSKFNVFLRDGKKCLYCGGEFDTDELTVDHIIPRCKGGKTEWMNVATCCVACNRKKDNLTLAQAGMVLSKKPKEPSTNRMIFTLTNKDIIKPSWRPYLFGGNA